MVLFDAISSLETFLQVFVYVYVLVIFLYVLTSWVQLPYSLRPVQHFLYEAVDPYLRLWRRILPRAGPIDLSPMVAVIALLVVVQIAVAVLDRLH